MASAGSVKLEFSQQGSIGGTAGPYGPVNVAGINSATLLYTGAGPGFAIPVEFPPTPWVRITVTQSVADTVSFSIHTTPRG